MTHRPLRGELLKRDKSSPSTPEEVFYARTFVLAWLILLGYLVYYILLPFYVPLAWALFIAFLLHPLHTRFSRQLGGRISLSAALLTFATFLMLVGPIAALGAAFGAQVADLLRWVPQYANDHGASQFSDITSAPFVGSALTW